MKLLTIPKVGARILETYVSARQARFKPRDSRKWSKIADRLIEAQGEYDRIQEALSKDVEQVGVDPTLDDSERASQTRQLSGQISAHDLKEGAELVSIEMDDEDISFLLGQYEACEFPANRQWRTWTEQILSALEKAEPIKAKITELKSESEAS